MTFDANNFAQNIIKSDKILSQSDLNIRPFSWMSVFECVRLYSLEDQRAFFYSLGKHLDLVERLKPALLTETINKRELQYYNQLMLDIYRPLKNCLIKYPDHNWSDSIYMYRSMETSSYIHRLSIFENGVILGPHPNSYAINALLLASNKDAQSVVNHLGVDLSSPEVRQNIYKAKKQCLEIYTHLDHAVHEQTTTFISILTYTVLPQLLAEWDTLNISQRLSLLHADLTVHFNNEDGTPDTASARLRMRYAQRFPAALIENICMQLQVLQDEDLTMTSVLNTYHTLTSIDSFDISDIKL